MMIMNDEIDEGEDMMMMMDEKRYMLRCFFLLTHCFN